MMMRNMQRNHGFAMIEVLVSVLLFLLGILALIGMQASMSKNVTQAKFRGEASFLANELIGRMWADYPNLTKYAITANACADNSYDNCTNWLNYVTSSLPNGGAVVTVNGGAVDVTVNWTLPGESPSKLQISANITN
jgi:type IV pilus assembly protein PilV